MSAPFFELKNNKNLRKEGHLLNITNKIQKCLRKILLSSEYYRTISKNGLKWLKREPVSKFFDPPLGKLAAPCWKQFLRYS
jgi:hypothetical protein